MRKPHQSRIRFWAMPHCNSQHRQHGAWKLRELSQTGFPLLANVQKLAETAFPRKTRKMLCQQV